MKLHTKILIGMVLGLTLGLLLGPNGALLPQDSVALSGAAVVEAPGSTTPAPGALGLEDAVIIQENAEGVPPGWVQVEWSVDAQELLVQKRRLELEKKDAATLAAVKPGAALRGWVDASGPKVTRYSSWGQRAVDWTEWIGRVFLALIKMVVVPLVFCSLLVGVASLGDLRRLGRLGGRTMAWFTCTTVAALGIGLALVNLVKPGHLLAMEDREALLASYASGAGKAVGSAASAPSMLDQLVNIIPTNPLGALASGDMLPVIFFALMVGVALTLLDPKRSQKVVDVVDVTNDAMIMLVHIAMKLAPFGVAAMLFKVAGTTGISVLAALGVYAVVVVAGLLVHLVVVYGGAVVFGARLPFLGFLGAMRSAALLAFSTSSSSATLPVTKECVEQNLNVSPQVASFVLPLGATVNMDGTALYQGVAAVFIAQIYGMELGFADQLTIVVTATLASVGAAGVPGAGMVTLALVLTAIGVPTEGLALILGVDRLLDMFRTTVNVIGDAAATAFMARLEGNKLHILTDAEDAQRADRGFEGRLDGGARPVPTEPDSHIAEPEP